MDTTTNQLCSYESFNASTGCYVPRSCRSCLLLSECMVNQNGACEPVEYARPEHHFTRAFALNLTLPAAKDTLNDSMQRATQKWEFPATQVKYCAADDAVCRQCVREEFWLRPVGLPTDSRFCVGADGCVCVFNCESGPPAGPHCEDGSQAIVDVLPPRTTSPDSATVTSEDCLYASYNTSTDCVTFRSCRSCLAKAGCRIGIDGYCGAETDFKEMSSDYHLASEWNLVLPAARVSNGSGLEADLRWWFPASELDYCPVNDTTCSACESSKFWIPPRAPQDSRFCMGENRCVCIANCARDDTISKCPSPTPAQTTEAERFERDFAVVAKVVTVLLILGFVAGGLAIVYCGFVWYKTWVARVAQREQMIHEAQAVDGMTSTYVDIVDTTPNRVLN